jgi:hypothetical protein
MISESTHFFNHFGHYGVFSSLLGDSSSTILLGSFHANATYFVWLPLAKRSPLLFVKFIDVKASVLPTTFNQRVCETKTGTADVHLSQVTSALIKSPILPPEER